MYIRIATSSIELIQHNVSSFTCINEKRTADDKTWDVGFFITEYKSILSKKTELSSSLATCGDDVTHSEHQMSQCGLVN
jgi:hypothetical protein